MQTPSADPATPRLKLPAVIAVLSDITRWQILAELAKGEPLPVSVLAKRLGAERANISKHCGVLCDAGLIHHGAGRDYRLTESLLVPGERKLELGWAVIRLENVRD